MFRINVLVLFLQAIKMELKNERNSLEKKIQVSPNCLYVFLDTYSACWDIFCYMFINMEKSWLEK